MSVVHAHKPTERYISHGILANEIIVPIKLVFDDVRRDKPIVATILCEFATGTHVYHEAIRISLKIAGPLVVQVDPKAVVVMAHVTAEGPEGRVLWTNSAQGLALPLQGDRAVGPNAVFKTGHAILDDVICHPNHVDACCIVQLYIPGTRALFVPRADDDIVAQCIEHFVAIFCVNSSGGNIPHNVALHQRSVGTMDGDANLGRLINSIAHKDAISALSGMVKMEAILSHVILLATELNAGVPHVHDAPMGRNGV